VSGSGISWAYANLHLAPDNHASIPLLSFFTGRMPFLMPNQQRQTLHVATANMHKNLVMFGCVVLEIYE